ncbi:MAG: HAD family phosphatase [Kiritimatiellae bacterium]|jgi:HAD superfamily hydrolase (TIGR01509 family)|nr:HAD family phosphatase [Kiritimatiellia bacterium]
MIKAIIFDLDGTLVDTELLWVEAMNNYLKDLGCDCTSKLVLEMVFGHSWVDIYHDITKHFPLTAEISSEEMALVLSKYHQRLCNEGDDIVIKSSVKVLHQLAEKYPVIVVSGSPRQDIFKNLITAKVDKKVQFVLGAEDYAPGKPSPAGFLKGAEMLGVKPAECIVFEDSQAGVTAAKSAGMHCVALARASAYKQDVSHADLIVSDLSEFNINVFAS